VTTAGRSSLTPVFLEKIDEFFALCHQKLANVNPKAIFTMDETAIRLDAPS
jgi:hypothetical protein